jgi:hypothetical protein
MRSPIDFRQAAMVIAALVLPIAATAQKFQEPTKEELQMTADPKAPGAAAVYLNFEETTDDVLHMQSVHARIKVLSDSGKDAGILEIAAPSGDFSTTDVQTKPNMDGGDWILSPTSHKSSESSDPWAGFRIAEIKARVIHSDGTVIPVDAEPQAQSLTGTSETHSADRLTGTRIFKFPPIEAGSILEYRYQIRYDEHRFASPHWDVQKKYYVRQAKYSFSPYKEFLINTDGSTGGFLVDAHGRLVHNIFWWPVLPPGVQVEKDPVGHFNLTVKNIPPLPHEEWMPPIDTISYHVLFYYTNALDEKEFWSAENKRWTKAIDHLAEPTPAIKSAVTAVITPSDSDLDKAKKLYLSVQSLRNTDFQQGSDAATQPVTGGRSIKRADDTLAQKSGSRQEITLLYLAMLRAAGVTAYDMRVVNRDRGTYTSGWLSSDQFDDDIIVATLNGKETALDPGEQVCPFATLHWHHAGARGIRQSASGPILAVSPTMPYAGNTLQRLGDVTVGENGSFQGTARIIIHGQEALYWRQLALAVSADEFKKRFDQSLESALPHGSEALVDHFLGLDTPESQLVAMVNLRGTLAADASGHFLLPTAFFESSSHYPFVDQASRQVPVDMHYGEQVIDQLVYHVPPGFGLASKLEDSKVPWEGHAVVTIRTAAEPGKVAVARVFTRAFAVLNPDEYPALHDFYLKMADADRRQLTLTSPASQSGN